MPDLDHAESLSSEIGHRVCELELGHHLNLGKIIGQRLRGDRNTRAKLYWLRRGQEKVP